MDLTENPYLFLKHSINICMVDDDPNLLQIYSEILNCYNLYSVVSCSNVSEAELTLSSRQRFHICIMDLGLDDINNDEFYLLKKFSPRTSFIVLTGNASIKKGFECGKYGSLSVFEKPVDFSKIDFINAINRAFICSLVSSCSKFHKPVIEKIIEALFIYNPVDIFDWAFNANVTEQYLRRVWNTIYGYQPKYFLWLYRMMHSAFSFYNSEFLIKTGTTDMLPDLNAINDEKEILSAEKYFQCNKSVFNRILYEVQDTGNAKSEVEI
jgi:FixJ family two-component response regulator